MKRRHAYFLLPFLLASCTDTLEFQEQRKTLNSLPSIDSTLSQSLKESCLENQFADHNGLFSPIGSKLIDLYKSDDDRFNELYSQMNVQMTYLTLKDIFATAATTGNEDNGKFRDSVARFEGSIDELNKSIKDYFQVEVNTVFAPGVYYYSYFVLIDAFPIICEEVDDLTFNGVGSHEYVSYKKEGKYYEDENCAIAELNLSETTFRVMMIKEGKSAPLEKIFTQELQSGLIDVLIPKFEIKTDSTKSASSGRLERQIDNFRFDNHGIYGTSFVYNAPTSSQQPPEVAFEFVFDKTFAFASFANDVPLFYGQVAELE